MSGNEEAQRDALAEALCLLDTLGGEGVGHVYGNGQRAFCDDLCVKLADAFDIPLEAGWWRTLPEMLIAPPSPDPEAIRVEVEVTQADIYLASWFTRRMDGGASWDTQVQQMLACHRSAGATAIRALSADQEKGA